MTPDERAAVIRRIAEARQRNCPDKNPASGVRMCRGCGLTKPVAEFYVRKDGWRYFDCKRCYQAKFRDWRKEYRKRPEVRARKVIQDRLYVRSEKGRALQRRRSKQDYRGPNAYQVKARLAVSHAIREQRLVRQPCEVLGCGARAQAHHHDYSRPLDVSWLCPPHHRQYHAGIFNLRWIANPRAINLSFQPFSVDYDEYRQIAA